MDEVRPAPSAVAFVQSAQDAPWGQAQWWRLEASALSAAPEVREAMAPVASPEALVMFQGPPRGWRWLLLPVALLRGVVVLAGIIAPFFALGIGGSWLLRHIDQPVPVGQMGLFAGIGLLCMLISAAESLISRSVASYRGLRAVAAIHMVFSSVALALIVFGLLSRSEARDPEWVWVVAADAVMGAILFFTRAGRPTILGDHAHWRRIDELVGRLDLERQSALRADLDAAVAQLVEEGKITGEEAARARLAPLGRVASTLAPVVRGEHDSPANA